MPPIPHIFRIDVGSEHGKVAEYVVLAKSQINAKRIVEMDLSNYRLFISSPIFVITSADTSDGELGNQEKIISKRFEG